jgi:hypothetical protein
VKEVCVDLAVKGICTCKGAEATALVAEAAAAGGAAESNVAIIKANVQTRMLALEALIGDEGFSAADSAYFFDAPLVDECPEAGNRGRKLPCLKEGPSATQPLFQKGTK